MIRRVVPVLLGGAYLLLSSLASLPVRASSETPLVISEIMTGGLNDSGTEDGQIEFIELHNQTSTEIDVRGWKVQYLSATRTDVLDPTVAPTSSREVVLEGNIGANGYVLLAHHDKVSSADVYFGEGDSSSSGWLAKSGGHVRLVSPSGITDLVGWGSAAQPETQSSTAPDPGQSIERQSDPNDTDKSLDTDDNGFDFVISTEPTPQGGSLILPPDSETEEDPPAEPEYYTLVITELLPDPASPKTDSNDEFVELYNPHPFAVNVKNYVLYTGSTTSTYKFMLPDATLQPGEYRAFYSSETSLTLVNSTGYAWLTDPNGTQLNETQWYENIGSEKSWALFGESWQITNTLTPSAANVVASLGGSGGVEDEETDSVLAPCGEGKYRNPITNRCKSIANESSSLTTCKPGQTRNPETNRCKSLTGLGSVLSTCKSGQERNPATNRCRKVAGVSTSKTSCQPGYERNASTNRCRKIRATLSGTGNPIDDASSAAQRLNLSVLGGVSMAAISYGVYEYRNDLRNTLARLRARFSKSR